MKVALLPLVLMLASCAHTFKVPRAIPAFHKKKVCSEESLKYLKGHSQKAQALAAAPMRELMACYEKFGAMASYNACLVAGFDKEGKQEFFEISSREVTLSDDIKKCFSEISQLAPFTEMKNATVLQPLRFYPK